VEQREGATDERQLQIFSRIGPMWRLRLALFIMAGGLLGFLGFWGAPLLLEALVTYNKEVLGSALFICMFWIFINIRHYFLDNVLAPRQPRLIQAPISIGGASGSRRRQLVVAIRLPTLNVRAKFATPSGLRPCGTRELTLLHCA
jgi:hypothetical protein